MRYLQYITYETCIKANLQHVHTVRDVSSDARVRSLLSSMRRSTALKLLAAVSRRFGAGNCRFMLHNNHKLVK